MTGTNSIQKKGGLAFTTKTVKCPQCSGTAIYSEENQFRPFCSKACQIGDLAAWATDEYKVAGSPLAQNMEEHSGDDEDQI